MRSLLLLGVLGAAGLVMARPEAARAAPPAEAARADRPVRIDLQVPAGAEVWFGGPKTMQTGSFRRFVSPPLTPGRDYAWTVRVRWTEDGRTIDRTRNLSVRAGDRLRLDYAAVGSGLVYVARTAEPAVTETRSFYQAPATPADTSAAYYAPLTRPVDLERAYPAAEGGPYDIRGRRYYYPSEWDYSPPGPPSSNAPGSIPPGDG